MNDIIAQEILELNLDELVEIGLAITAGFDRIEEIEGDDKTYESN